MSSGALFPQKRREEDKQSQNEQTEPGQIQKAIGKVLQDLSASLLMTDAGSPQGGGESETAEVYSKPSFFERLRQIDDPDELLTPTIADVFPEEEFIAFSFYHDVETESARALFRGTSYRKLIESGALQRLHTFMKGFDHISDDWERKILIPVGELHCPNVKGAKAVYESTTSHEEKVSLSISIAGIGAEASTSRTVEVTSKLETSAGDCAGLVCDADILISHWENPETHRKLDLISKIVPDDFISKRSLEKLPILEKVEDVCLDQNAYAILWNRVELLGLKRRVDYHTAGSTGSGKSEPGIRVEKKHEYSAKFELLLETLGLKKVVEVKSHYTKTIKFNYELPHEYEYIAANKAAGKQPMTWGAKEM